LINEQKHRGDGDGDGFKSSGDGVGMEKNPWGGVGSGRNYVDAGRVRVEVVTPRGGDGVKS